VTEGEVKIPYGRDATSSLVFQITTPTPKISLTITEISNIGRGFAGILATGRELVPADRPIY
jgi:hypothetical protein